MRIVIQRVQHAQVRVDDILCGKIQQGMMLLVGITHEDNEDIVMKMATKVASLRIFEDTQGKMNLGLGDVQGAILSISQFTLYGNCRKGRRPSFDEAAKPDVAKQLYDRFNQALQDANIHVETGIFGADMKVELVNDGPVTILLDSKDIG